MGLKYYLKSWKKHFKIVAFYPYTSHTLLTIYSTDYNHETPDDEWLNDLISSIKEEVKNKLGYNSWDNKVVVELQPIVDLNASVKLSNIFIGWYDNKVTVALGMWQEEYISKYNKTL